MNGSDLSGANLTDVVGRGIKLVRVDLRGAILQGANLSGGSL
ncbi:MAG: pentapeptide repeat-containing protein, partial [Planctomycetota bacterium]